MAFSWKAAKKRAIRKLKDRKQNYLKNGKTTEAKDIDRRIVRLEKDALP